MVIMKRHEDETTDYRRGFVEGQAGERDAYLMFSGCTDKDEYCRGFLDGIIGHEGEFDGPFPKTTQVQTFARKCCGEYPKLETWDWGFRWGARYSYLVCCNKCGLMTTRCTNVHEAKLLWEHKDFVKNEVENKCKESK